LNYRRHRAGSTIRQLILLVATWRLSGPKSVLFQWNGASNFIS
jgi:hypothetical protein